MIKTKVKMTPLRINLQAYESALEDQAMTVIAMGVIEFIDVVTTIVPVWSGASQATLLKLAEAVGSPLPIAPEVTSRIPLGQQHSDAQFIADRAAKRYFFEYTTDLPHLLFNNLNNANDFGFNLRQPGPYALENAVEPVLNSVLKRFDPPDIRKFM